MIPTLSREKSPLLESPTSGEVLPPGSRIAYICDSTDADPENGIINGVKNTQLNLTKALQKLDYDVDLIFPKKEVDGHRLFQTLGLPGYEDLGVTINPLAVTNYLAKQKPDALFISTVEGPLGMAAAYAAYHPWLVGQEKVVPYTASFTTLLVEYLVENINKKKEMLVFAKPLLDGIVIQPESFSWLHSLQRGLYNGAHKILIPSLTTWEKLENIGLNVSEKGVFWPRGIDTEIFHPPEIGEENIYQQYEWFRDDPKPIALFFGRVGVEKNIEAFLRQNSADFHFVVIGDGPAKEELQQKYPHVHFLGKKFNPDLAAHVRWASVHIFPSLTDTFGNTNVEASGSGVPTIGFAGVPGAQDIVTPGVSGYVIADESELLPAMKKALQLSRQKCAADITSRFSWNTAARTLAQSLQKIEPASLR